MGVGKKKREEEHLLRKTIIGRGKNGTVYSEGEEETDT